MDPQTIATIGLAIAVGGHAFAYWVKTPKEESAAINNKVSDLDRRLTQIEVQNAGTHARFDEAIDNLKEAVDELKEVLTKLWDKMGMPQKARARAAR